MGYAVFFGVLAGAMIAFPGPAAEAARAGLRLWATAVAPVLGPFMACMLMVTSRLRGGAGWRVFLAWLCGSPGGARLMQTLKPVGAGALRLAAMTGTMSPMFLLGPVSAWLADARAGRIILACHVLSALALGLCIQPDRGFHCPPPAPMPLSQALRDSAQALLMIALCMMLGCVSARMAVCALPGLPPAVGAALQCILEVTAGIRALIALQGPGTVPLVCAACSFGGLSLLMQNAAFWQESGVTMSRLLLLRLLHAALAGSLGMILWELLQEP